MISIQEGAGSAEDRFDVIVVGGGLAGLSTALLVAHRGCSVVVLERSGHVGGRAATELRQEIRFNLGPHALYCEGHAFRLFHALGIPFAGGFPDARHGVVVDHDALYPIPRSPGGLLASRLLGLRQKWRFVRLLGRLDRLDTRKLDGVPLSVWIKEVLGDGQAAALLRMFMRIGTYANDHDRLSTGAAIDQFRMAQAGNVWYLDGGWQTLVDGLRRASVERGVAVRERVRVEAIEREDENIVAKLAGGGRVNGRTVVLAVGPGDACKLLGMPSEAPISRWAAKAIPVHAGCLDLALEGLPVPGRHVAFGLDQPLYYSVHSASARLAPEGVVMLHLMKYLKTDHSHGAAGSTERELNDFLERLQPGARGRVVERRFLPRIEVVPALPAAAEGGLSGRPGIVVAERPGVFLAGDWVGARVFSPMLPPPAPGGGPTCP